MRLFLLFAVSATALLGQGLPQVFREIKAVPLRDTAPDTKVLRSRKVALKRELFDTGAASGVIGHGRRLLVEFNLFEDVRYNVSLDRAEHVAIPEGGLVWTGSLEGLEHSDVVIAAVGDIHTGVIRTGRGDVYSIRNVSGAVHEIEQVDTRRFAKEALPRLASLFTRSAEPLPSVALADDGSQIDVLVVYSAAARLGAGGDSQMQAAIAAAIASTNTAYQKSGITQRLRLAGTSEVSYFETGSSDLDLDRVTDIGDGFLDEVHTLRNNAKADIVSFWVEYGDACGIAWLLKQEAGDFAPLAFNVVMRECALSNLTLAHELGHNMGAEHDIDNSQGAGGYFPYSYGYQQRTTPPYWRTIMAYECESLDCPKIDYFSSPGIQYDGRPAGNSNADNAGTLNGTRSITANFRQATGAITIAPTSASVGATQTTGFLNVTAAAGVSWTAVSNSAWIVITSGTQGSGSGTVNYRVDANPTTDIRSGNITINGVVFSLMQAASGITCTIIPIALPESTTAALSSADCISPIRPDVRAKRFTFNATAGQRISVAVSSSDFNAYAMLLSPSGTVLGQDDNGGGGTNARVPALGSLTLPASGIYTIEVTSAAASPGGAFTLFLTSDGAAPNTGANGPFRFVALNPCRVADSRANSFGGAFGPPRYSAGETRVLPLRIGGCNIPSDARAYSLNFTVVPQGPLGYLTTWPSDQARPLVSTLNAPRGNVVANAAIVPASADGSISVFVSNATDVVIDINGYFSP